MRMFHFARVSGPLLRMAVCIFCACCASAPVSALAEQGREELSRPMQEALYNADQAMNKKQYAQAEKILGDYMAKHPAPKHHFVEFLLGNALIMQGKNARALEHYTSATALRPDFAPAWANQGKAAYDLGQYAVAGRALGKAYELDGKKDGALLYQSAAAYLMGKRNAEALPALERLASGALGAPRQEWLEALLKTYMELGKGAKAAQTVKGLLARDQENPGWWKLLAQMQTRQHNYKEALSAWEVYATLAGTIPAEEEILIGDIYSAAGVPLRAAQWYARALPRTGSGSLREKLARSYLAAHQPAQAASFASKAASERPGAEMWRIAGQAYFELGEYRKAYDAYTESLRLDASDGRSQLMQGYCALQLRNKSLASAALEKARKYSSVRAQAEQLLRAVAAL